VNAALPDDPHIAGDAAALGDDARRLIALAQRLGHEHFAERAARVDRDAAFPRDNFRDLREAGLLALAVPRAFGGHGADLATTALVCAEIGRHCGSTALAFTMHLGTCTLAGLVADALPISGSERAEQLRHARVHFGRIVNDGWVYAQAFSETGAAASGTAPWTTRALKVEGGYRISGRKAFTSLAGEAESYAVQCTLDEPERPAGGSQRDTLVLAVPASTAGVSVSGDWDAMGMRGTVTRTLHLDDVFLPIEARMLPEGWAAEAMRRFPHAVSLLAAPYMGIAQAAYDFTVHYLRAEWPGMAPVKRRMYPTKQIAVAQMRILLEQTRALFLGNLREARLDPDHESRMRLYAAHYSVMENVQALCALAIRTCGGQAMVRSLPLERMYRDARCGSLMLPLTAELCLDHLGRECLYGADEGGEAIE
jgi:alkylation response protein AidB-like acyl-CoA dehydrogenase